MFCYYAIVKLQNQPVIPNVNSSVYLFMYLLGITTTGMCPFTAAVIHICAYPAPPPLPHPTHIHTHPHAHTYTHTVRLYIINVPTLAAKSSKFERKHCDGWKKSSAGFLSRNSLTNLGTRILKLFCTVLTRPNGTLNSPV